MTPESRLIVTTSSFDRRGQEVMGSKPCSLVPFPWASLMAQQVENLPAMQEVQVRSLGQGDPLEEKMATHSSILAWKIPWTEEPGGFLRHMCRALPWSPRRRPPSSLPTGPESRRQTRWFS